MQDTPIQVTRSSMPPFEEYIDEIRHIWDSAWLTNMGPLHQCFEKEVTSYLGVENVSLFNNGHLALYVAIKALGLTGEVVTTPYTFASTTHAISQNNLKPVFCDINEADYTMDVLKLEDLITEKTTAIIPVHVYGSICNIDEIDRIAKKYRLKVIYDAAHAFGITQDGRGIGTFGDVSMFSFHATKVFHTIEGGALTYSASECKSRFNMLKNFGITSPESVDEIGTNAKMNEFQAAMGICNLKHVDEEILKRKKVVERYRELLEGTKGIRLAKEQKGVKPNYAYFPVIFDELLFGKTRDDVFGELARNSIYARKYFYPLINDLNCYKDTYSSNDTPVAKYIADRVLTLPLYADLEINDVDRICKIILKG